MIRKEGLLRRAKRKIFAFFRAIPDMIRGTDFAKEVIWDGEGMDDFSRYSASTHKLFRKVRHYLKSFDLTEENIIDIGCGKGKAVWLLARSSGKNRTYFRKTDGVDFSEELCIIAEKNMKRLGLESKIYHSDAAKFNKYGDYSFYYMFNPMKGDLLRNTVKLIKKSVDDNPRVIHIIYCNPWSRDILIDEGFVVEKKLAQFFEVFTYNPRRKK